MCKSMFRKGIFVLASDIYVAGTVSALICQQYVSYGNIRIVLIMFIILIVLENHYLLQ